MKKIISNVIIILILCVLNSLSSEEEDGCSFSENEVLCKNVSGKFLSHDGNKEMHLVYIQQSDLRNLTNEDFADYMYVTTVSIYRGLFDFSRHDNLFGNLTGLQVLRIENSNVTEDVKVTFSRNYHILELILTGNKIATLRKDFLGHLKHVEKIDLSNNLIEFIEIGIFDELPSLTQLNLSRNKLGHGFHSGFLTLSNSQCVVCRTKSIQENCTREDVTKCKENEHIDQLWWKTHSIEITLENNPICTLITGDASTVTQGQESKNTDDDEIDTCTVYEMGSCFKHEGRRMFLFDVCAIQNYSLPNRKEVDSSIGVTAYKHIVEDKATDGNVLSSGLSLVIAGALLGCIVTGIVVLSWNILKKRGQPSNHTYKKVKSEDTSLHERDYSDSQLHIAARMGHLEDVKDLVGKGEKAFMANKHGDTPLHLAAQGNHKEVVEFLLKQDVDVNSQNKAQDTPLIIAARKNHLSTVKVLLAQGSDRGIWDVNGYTPLHLAVTNGNDEMVKSLLEKDRTEMVDKGGRTPLLAAAAASHSDIVDLLLQHNANVHATAIDGRTPLHFACWNGNKVIVDLLLEKNASVNTKDKKGYTPLHNASRKGHVEVLKLLLQREGVDVNAANGDGNTPLHQAAHGGHDAIVQLLLDKGADRNRVNGKGKTPLDVASERGHSNCEVALKLRE